MADATAPIRVLWGAMYERLERVAAWAFPAMAFAVVAAIAVHLHDRFGINHVSGSQLALTRHFQAGRLDPPFFDPPVIGGTRFSPVPTLIHAGIDLLVGDLFVSGRIMTSGFALSSPAPTPHHPSGSDAT